MLIYFFEVSSISAQLQKSADMDDARLIEQQADLIRMLDAVRSHQHNMASAPSNYFHTVMNWLQL